MRQLKDYHVTIGNVDNERDNPAFGTANVKATDALAAANQVNKNLGKRQYVASVALAPTAELLGYGEIKQGPGVADAVTDTIGEPVTEVLQ
jgi:hypothetical protein